MGPKKAKKEKKGKKKAGNGNGADGGDDGAAREAEAARLELVRQAKALLELTRREEQAFNEFQQQREKLNYFWIVEKKALEDRAAELRNKERARQDLEEKHAVEIKVYKQRVKHLLFEHQRALAEAQSEQARALAQAQQGFRGHERALRGDKRRLQRDLKEVELSHQDYLTSLKQEQDRRITLLRQEFERGARELSLAFERRRKAAREALEAKRKADAQAIEERKNLHIAQLMAAHEQAFGEIKSYYNDITHNNLDLIKSLKEEAAELARKEAQDEKLMFEVAQENKRMSEPLKRALADVERLRRALADYQRDRGLLRDAKAELLVLEHEFAAESWEHEVLGQRAAQVQRELDELSRSFHASIFDVQQKTSLHSLLLDKKMAAATRRLERKDAELGELLLHAKLDPAVVERVKGRLEDVLAHKALDQRELERELARVADLRQRLATAVRAKMSEYGLPLDELGFVPRVQGDAPAVGSSFSNGGGGVRGSTKEPASNNSASSPTAAATCSASDNNKAAAMAAKRETARLLPGGARLSPNKLAPSFPAKKTTSPSRG